MSQGREMGSLFYEQPGYKVDGSYHSKDRGQVNKGGTNGEQKGMEKSKKQGDYFELVIYARVHNECL
jgi:hypothetical protein